MVDKSQSLNAAAVWIVGPDGNPVYPSGGTGTAANQVQGTSASGAADDGSNPVKVGGVVLPTAGNITALSAGQRTNAGMDKYGSQRSSVTLISMAGTDGFPNSNVGYCSADYSADTASRSLTATLGFVFNGTSLDRQRGDTIGTYMVSKGTAGLSTSQVAVTTSATQVVAARAGRQAVTITSTSAVVFYVGASGVTTSTGHYVAAAAGASITIPTAAAVFAVGASALTVTVLETF